MDLREAKELYIKTFDEGPPIFEMEEKGAIAAIIKAVETGKEMEYGTEKNIPKDAYL